MNALSNLTPRGRAAAVVALMIAASVALSFGFACALPLAAFATAAGMLLGPTAAVGAVLAVWLVNQAIGFACLGYPTNARARSPGARRSAPSRSYRSARRLWCSRAFKASPAAVSRSSRLSPSTKAPSTPAASSATAACPISPRRPWREFPDQRRRLRRARRPRARAARRAKVPISVRAPPRLTSTSRSPHPWPLSRKGRGQWLDCGVFAGLTWAG